MKRLSFFAIIALCAVMVSCNCKKETAQPTEEKAEITVTFNVYVKNCKFKCGNTTLKEQEFLEKGKKYTFRGKTGTLLKKYSKNSMCLNIINNIFITYNISAII